MVPVTSAQPARKSDDGVPLLHYCNATELFPVTCVVDTLLQWATAADPGTAADLVAGML